MNGISSNTSEVSSMIPSQQHHHQPTSPPPQLPPPPIPAMSSSQQNQLTMPNIDHGYSTTGNSVTPSLSQPQQQHQQQYSNYVPSYQQQQQQQWQQPNMMGNNQYGYTQQQQQNPQNSYQQYQPQSMQQQSYPQAQQYQTNPVAYQQQYMNNNNGVQYNSPQPQHVPQQMPPSSASGWGQQNMNSNMNNNNTSNNAVGRYSSASYAGSTAPPSNSNSHYSRNNPSGTAAAATIVGRGSTAISATASRGIRRPPYVDPNTNIVYDVNDPEYEGWLSKQSQWLKEWRKRYFILKGSKLFFCKHPTSGAPHGMMDLSICTTVKSADLKSGKFHSFEISTPDTCYLLYADTEGEKDDWIGRVGKAIVRCSRTYYKGDSSNNDGTTAHNNNQEGDDDDIYENDDPDSPYFND